MKEAALEDIEDTIRKYKDILNKYNGSSVSAVANLILVDLYRLKSILERR